MPDPKATLTTRNVATLLQLETSGRLKLTPALHRERRWPKTAKASFINSILKGQPLAPIYLVRTTCVQSGRTEYTVIDGQQRIRALKEFLNNGFGHAKVEKQNVSNEYKSMKFSHLPLQMQQKILNFDFVVLELSNYSESVIREVFSRMSKHVARLSRQELRRLKDLSTSVRRPSMK